MEMWSSPSGKTAQWKEKQRCFTTQAIYTWEASKTIEDAGQGYTFPSETATNTKESSQTIYSKGRASSQMTKAQ